MYFMLNVQYDISYRGQLEERLPRQQGKVYSHSFDVACHLPINIGVKSQRFKKLSFLVLELQRKTQGGGSKSPPLPNIPYRVKLQSSAFSFLFFFCFGFVLFFFCLTDLPEFNLICSLWYVSIALRSNCCHV